MTEFLLVCSCFNMKNRAKEAFALLLPNRILPDLVKGRDRIYKLGQSTGNEHILAISKLSGKYAYYVRLDEENKIVEEWDLLRGKRIA